MKKKLHDIQIALCLVVLTVTPLLLIFWTVYPYKLFTFYTDKIPVVTHVLKRGDTLKWEVESTTNYDDIKCTITRELRDDIVTTYPPLDYVTKKGYNHFINASLVLPKSIDTGTYYLHLRGSCHVNPVRDIVFERDSETFEVIK
jgi:hypothetical protein